MAGSGWEGLWLIARVISGSGLSLPVIAGAADKTSAKVQGLLAAGMDRDSRIRMSVQAVVLACLLAGFPALSLGATPEYSFDAQACPFREKGWFDPQRMDCGTVVADESGVGQVRIPALRIRKARAGSRTTPVVFINGGPGGRGVTEVGDWLGHPLLEHHDLILHDPRGTGAALPLPCPDLGEGFLSLISMDIDPADELEARSDMVASCLQSIPAPMRRTFDAAHMASDVDAIRRMFAYEVVSLYGVSYGTRIATAYADMFPAHLDKLLLDSVVPNHTYYGEIARTFDASLAKAFQQCEDSSDCRTRFPEFRNDYRDLLESLRSRLLLLHVPGSAHVDDMVALDAHDFSMAVQQLLYSGQLIPTLPLMIDELKRGNSAPLAVLFDLIVGSRVKSLNFATYYLVLGNEEFPMWKGAQAREEAPASDLLFFEQDMILLESLEMFSEDVVPANRLAFSGPVLVIAGSFDPVTAPSYGATVADEAADARYLEFPSSGHTPSLTDDCARVAAIGFLSQGHAAKNPLCLESMAPVAWAGDVRLSPWPGNWLASMIFQRSLAPVFWLAAPLLLYVALGAWAFGRLLRGLTGIRSNRVAASDANAFCHFGRIAAGTGLAAGVGMMVTLGLVLFHVATGPAPALLLFGLPYPAFWILLALAAVVVVSTLAIAALSLQAILRRDWRRGSHLPSAGVGLANVYLLGTLLRWQVLASA